ncbi:MAG: hypothetical protein LW627_05295 [Ilumatobacteraceae bacterium]|nr:hypothetical protein [Ilumatobacteraceae bacterium]
MPSPNASPALPDLIEARVSIVDAQRILDQSRCHGPVIESLSRELAHLAGRLRSIEETWFE